MVKISMSLHLKYGELASDYEFSSGAFIKIICALALPSQIFFSYFLDTVLYENMIIVNLKMN